MAWQLEVLEGPDHGSKAKFRSGIVTIGRDASQCILVLNDADVSRLHARVTLFQDGILQVEDLGSTNGTYLNDQRLGGAVQLDPNDFLKVGSSRIGLTWVAEEAEASGVWEQPSFAGAINIGRDPSNDLVINDPKVSRSHARLDLQDGRTCLTDLESAHGTYLNGQPVKGTVEISASSWLGVCDFNFYFDGVDLRGEDGAVAATLRGAAASDGQPLVQTLQLPFNRGDIFKLLIGVLLSLIPVVSFLTDGYRYRLFKGGSQGKMVMPEWKGWQDLFVRGLLFSLVQLVYLLPALLTLLFSLLVARQQPAGSGEGVIMVGLIFSFLFLLVAALFLPMGWAHFAATGRIGSAFEFGIIIPLIKTVTSRYAAFLLLMAGMWLLLGLIVLVPVLGGIVAIIGAFYIKVVFALLLGELYRLSLSLNAEH